MRRRWRRPGPTISASWCPKRRRSKSPTRRTRPATASHDVFQPVSAQRGGDAGGMVYQLGAGRCHRGEVQRAGMMTPAQAMELLRAVHALTRVKAVITSHAGDPDWAHVVTAIDDRLRWLRYNLSLADPGVVTSAEGLFEAERIAAAHADVTPRAIEPVPRILH